MNNKYIRYYSLFILFFTFVGSSIAKLTRSEFNLVVKNQLYINTADFSPTVNYQGRNKSFASVNNEFGQSLGLNYTYVLRKHFLLSPGIEFGYQPFSYKVDYPYEQAGFKRPVGVNDNYSLSYTMIYGRLNLNLGYRFKTLGIFTPEVRLVHMFHVPFNSKGVQRLWFAEGEANGSYTPNFREDASIGKPVGVKSFVMEMIEGIYLGTNIKSKWKAIDRFTAGLQLQRQLIFSDNPFNRATYTYYNTNYQIIAKDEFRGHHLAICLNVGFIF